MINRGERLSPLAFDHKDTDGPIEIDPVARMRERIVHFPGQRVHRLGAIERQRCDGAVDD